MKILAKNITVGENSDAYHTTTSSSEESAETEGWKESVKTKVGEDEKDKETAMVNILKHVSDLNHKDY